MQRAVLLLLAVGVALAAGALVEDTFENIKNSPAEQLVVFYRSSDPESKRVLKVIRKASELLEDELPRPFAFKKCDGDKPVNAKEFQEAQFTKGTYIFTSTPVEGIVKYTGPVKANTIAKHIMYKYQDYDPADVLTFQDEDAFYERMDQEEQSRPIFVKFFEQWCEHCKRLKEPFAIGATHFKDRVDFMEVECSKNDDTLAFCTHNDVKSYPTLILFTGEDKIKFEEEMRHVITFEKFFDKHITAPAAASEEAAEESEEEEVTASKKAKKSKKGKKGKKSKKAKRAVEEAAEEEEEEQASAKPEEVSIPAAPEATNLALEERVAVLEEEVVALKQAIRKLTAKKKKRRSQE